MIDKDKQRRKELVKAIDTLSRRRMTAEEARVWHEEGVILPSLLYSKVSQDGITELPTGQYYVVNVDDNQDNYLFFTVWEDLDKFLTLNHWEDWQRLSADSEEHAKEIYEDRMDWALDRGHPAWNDGIVDPYVVWLEVWRGEEE